MIEEIFLKRATQAAKELRDEKKCDVVIVENSTCKFESERFSVVTLDTFYANKTKHTKAVCFLIYHGE